MASKFGVLVLAISLVALGLAAYSLTQTPPTPAAVPGAGPRVALDDAVSDLETRLAAVEEARLREQGASAIDDGIRERLEDLDRRLKALDGARDASGSMAAMPPIDAPVTARATGEEPGPEDVERFRKLQAAAAKQRRAGFHRKRIEKALSDLRITLTTKQRDQLVASYGEFESRRQEIWGEVKGRAANAGPGTDWRPIIAETQRAIVSEFADRISTFIPRGDAESISRGLHSGGK
jgi:hypothetical protein